MGESEYDTGERVLLQMLFVGIVHTSAKLWQKQLGPLKCLVERMDCLMIAAGFAVFTDRFNQVLNYPAPVRERFPDFITHKSAFNTDTPYGLSARREDLEVPSDQATLVLKEA